MKGRKEFKNFLIIRKHQRENWNRYLKKKLSFPRSVKKNLLLITLANKMNVKRTRKISRKFFKQLILLV